MQTMADGQNEQDELMDVRAAAALLSVTGGRVRQLAGSGRLEGQKLSGRWVFRRSNVERFAAIPRPTGRPKESGEDEPAVLNVTAGDIRAARAVLKRVSGEGE